MFVPITESRDAIRDPTFVEISRGERWELLGAAIPNARFFD